MKVVCISQKIPTLVYLVYLVLFWEAKKMSVQLMSKAKDLSVRFKL